MPKFKIRRTHDEIISQGIAYPHKDAPRLYNITPQVEAAIAESGVREGLCLVNAMNITASVFINDNENGLHRDFDKWLERLAPEKPHDQYAHNVCEDNTDAHM